MNFFPRTQTFPWLLPARIWSGPTGLTLDSPLYVFSMTILLYTLVALVATAVIWKGSGWLESSSERLSVYYELPPIIQGAVVVAVGSSFPELTTAVFSTLIHGEFELGVAAIVGSALVKLPRDESVRPRGRNGTHAAVARTGRPSIPPRCRTG